MKKILFPCVFPFLLVIATVGNPVSAQPVANMVKPTALPSVYQLHVDGLACPFCAYGIEKKLSEVAGVANVQTDIRSGTVYVEMKAGSTLNEDAATKAVKAAGFSLHGMNPVAAIPQGVED